MNRRTPITPSIRISRFAIILAVSLCCQSAIGISTSCPARILNLRDYGWTVGCRADLVVWECERAEEIVMALPARRLVVKAGRVSVEHHRRTVERWRAGDPSARSSG